MLATAVFRPSTAEVIIEARDPELDYQYRLTFKTKVQGEEEEGGGGVYIFCTFILGCFQIDSLCMLCE